MVSNAHRSTCTAGAFAEHCAVLRKLDTESFEIRQKRDLEQDFDGLILVGGESTVMGKLLRELDCMDPLKQRIRRACRSLARVPV